MPSWQPNWARGRWASCSGSLARGRLILPPPPRLSRPCRRRSCLWECSSIPTKDWVCEVAEHVHLATIQLHGQETVAFCHDLPYPVIKAVPLRTTADIEAATGLPDDISVLLDATDPVSKGGTGRTIDWTMAAAAARTREVWLAGGLGPENVVEAVETVGPYGVDVSSGLETAPGVKDTGKMRAFFAALEQTWATQSRA